MPLIPRSTRARSLGVVAAAGALLATGCGVAAETTAATVNGVAITDEQVERAARIQLIGNVPLGEDDPVPVELRTRALSFLIASRLVQDEQAELNLDVPPELAEIVGDQLEQDTAFTKLSDGEKSDIVAANVALYPGQATAAGDQGPFMAQQILQALTSDPTAREAFRAEHPQMFRQVCADLAQAPPDTADEVAQAMAEDPDAAFETFGRLDQCQTAVATNDLVPRSSPQWPIYRALFSAPVGEVAGPLKIPVLNPDPATQGGGDTIDISQWVRPTGSRTLDDAESAEFVSSLGSENLVQLLALQPGSVEIDSRYGDTFLVGAPEDWQVVRLQPNGSGVASPANPGPV